MLHSLCEHISLSLDLASGPWSRSCIAFSFFGLTCGLVHCGSDVPTLCFQCSCLLNLGLRAGLLAVALTAAAPPPPPSRRGCGSRALIGGGVHPTAT